MNVLILVFIMLQILTIMTYHRLSTYLQSAGLRIEYEQYMSTDEREVINKTEDTRYKDAKSPSDGTGNSKPNGLLSLKPLVDLSKQKQTDPSQPSLTPLGQVVTDILKRLIEIVYQDKPFFQRAQEQYPNLAQDLIDGMVSGIAAKPCDLKFSEVNDLANISFNNPELQAVFYSIIKGEKSTPGQPESGILPLKSFVTTDKGNQINVVTAKRPLLLAIYRDAQTVDYLLESRKKLRLEVTNKSIPKEQAAKELQGLYGGQNHLVIDPKLVNFSF